MALISWGPTLAVGVKEIDDQHQKLIALINQLNDAMVAGKGKETVGKVLADLIAYTQYHFSTEERLMAQHRYEFTTAHKEEHSKLVREVGEFEKKFDAGNTFLSVEMMRFLRDWLSNHILASDKKLAKALNSASVS